MTTDFRKPGHDPENCPGCRPVVFDPSTGKPHDMLTKIAGRIFDASSPETRRAWHRVTCLNSKDLIDLNLAKSVVERLHRATAN